MSYTIIDAVNHVLLAANEPPVTSLTNETTAAATLAKMRLDRERVHVLSEGLQFNTRRASFSPTVQGHIPMGDNVLGVDGIKKNRTNKYTIVNKRLFDVDAGSDVFTGPVDLEVIYEYPFEQMPVWVQYRIMTAVALQFHAQFSADAAHMEVLQRTAFEALSRCNEKELTSHDIDMVSKSPMGQVARSGITWRFNGPS